MKSMYAFPLLALLSFNSFAGPIPNVQAPRELVDKNSEFAEGTMTQLSQQDVAQFIPWAQNARTVLKKALKDSESMTVVDQVEYLKNIMQSVVRHSSQKKYQMFMRFALNRSLLLVQELLKEADVREVGVIENALDIQLRGIELALSFFESDLSFQKRAQQGQDTVSMDYAKFGARFGSTMFEAINSVLDASAQYRLLYKTLEMINWDLSRDPKALDYSDTIVEVYNMLKSLNEIPDRSDSRNISNVRRLNVVVESVRGVKRSLDKKEQERELVQKNERELAQKREQERELALKNERELAQKREQERERAAAMKRKVCGLNGSIEERIQNCSSQTDSKKFSFILVARTKDLNEVRKDMKTGLLWGDLLPDKMSFERARKACTSSLNEVAGIRDVTWRLPTEAEYLDAKNNGILEALPNMLTVFWSSLVLHHPDIPWLFSGYGDVGYGDRYDDVHSVRCVAR